MPRGPGFSLSSRRSPSTLLVNGFCARQGLPLLVRFSARVIRRGWPAGKMRWKRFHTTERAANCTGRERVADTKKGERKSPVVFAAARQAWQSQLQYLNSPKG